MTAIVIAAIVIAALIVFGIIVWQVRAHQRSQELRDQFGPEYDRAVDRYGDQGKAEAELAERRDQVERVTIQPLSADDREKYAADWQSIQAQFVDDPGAAVSRADVLITSVMDRLGYQASAVEGREAVASVQYPDAAENYRQAHAIAQKQENGDATTEDLREAMIQYRSLFDKLVGTPSEVS